MFDDLKQFEEIFVRWFELQLNMFTFSLAYNTSEELIILTNKNSDYNFRLSNYVSKTGKFGAFFEEMTSKQI